VTVDIKGFSSYLRNLEIMSVCPSVRMTVGPSASSKKPTARVFYNVISERYTECCRVNLILILNNQFVSHVAQSV
jgi:hypothetical protein